MIAPQGVAINVFDQIIQLCKSTHRSSYLLSTLMADEIFNSLYYYIYIYLLGALEISPLFLYFVKILMYILKGQDVRDAG